MSDETTTDHRPAPPDGLREQGRGLWSDVLGDLPEGWGLDNRELHLLELAARQADVIADLEAVVKAEGIMVAGSTGQQVVHPAISEARQGRITVDRLLGKLVLPSGDDGDGSTSASTLASHAARTRWNRESRKEARNRGA